MAGRSNAASAHGSPAGGAVVRSICGYMPIFRIWAYASSGQPSLGMIAENVKAMVEWPPASDIAAAAERAYASICGEGDAHTAAIRNGDGLKRPGTSPKIPEAGRCNGTSLRKATRRVSQLYDAMLAPCGLRSTQRSILVNIARAGTPSIGELAGLLVLDRSAMAHNLKPLERDGLVKFVADKNDRRNRRVTLTEMGRARLAQSMPLWEGAQQRFETVFGARKAKELRTALEFIASPDFANLFSAEEART